MNKKICDKECDGIIKEINVRGQAFPSVIIVKYEVFNQMFELKENLVMKKHKIIKLGFIPIGYKTKSLIEIKTGIPAVVGNNVKVRYCSENPKKAYLLDNDAKITWY